MIERAEVLGEPPEDPMAPYSVLYGFWIANYVAGNGKATGEIAAQLLDLAEKQGATVGLIVGHRLVGSSLGITGKIAEGRTHLDQAIKLYDRMATARSRSGGSVDLHGVKPLSIRAMGQWALGYPEAARADVEFALRDARETENAANLIYALAFTACAQILLGNLEAATIQTEEAVALAEEKGILLFKAWGMMLQGSALALLREAQNAVRIIKFGVALAQSTGSRGWVPFCVSHLAIAHVDLGQITDARLCIGEATSHAETTGEKFFQGECYRIAGEIEQKSPERDTRKAEGYFERAIEIARAQQARSFELRAATSLARLRRDQGRRAEARELLAPVYGWFTEGFDTPDLKAAKVLLEELA